MKSNAGRKSKYYKQVRPFLNQIDEWLNNGATEKQVADALNVAYSSWSNYKTQFKELYNICEKPRVKVVLNARGALVKKAMGFTHSVPKAMKLKDIIYENGKKVRETERIEYYNEETYYPPETNAIFGVLNLYDPEYVKDKAHYELKKDELEMKKKVIDAELW